MDFENSKTKINLMRAFAGESMARNRYIFSADFSKKEHQHKNTYFIKCMYSRIHRACLSGSVFLEVKKSDYQVIIVVLMIMGLMVQMMDNHKK